MEAGAERFWGALARRLPEGWRGREREIARVVLGMLRHRIRPEEARHLRAELPEELAHLWSGRGVGLAERKTARPIAELDHDAFLGWVRDGAGLADLREAALASAAVFAALRELISAREAAHVERELPAGLKELWRGEAHARGPHEEHGPSRFWEHLERRLAGRIEASAPAVARAVLGRLRARLDPGLAGRIEAALPADLRPFWAGPAPGEERGEPPERFLGRVAAALELESEAGHRAVAAALGALRRVLPPELAVEVWHALPDGLRGAWDAG